MSLKISIVQTDLFWEDKAANLAMLYDKIMSIPHTEVVVLPEMFTTGFSMQPAIFAEKMDGTTIQWMKTLSAQKKVIITGSIMIEENGHFYNRLLWVLPNGQIGYYDKRHLFAYANEHEHYSAGNKRLIAQVKGWKINLQICYDMRFPVWARQSSSGMGAEYDVLIYVANWPEKRASAWKALLTARAIENQCYVVGVNRVGIDGNGLQYAGDSMVIDALGNIIFEKNKDEIVTTITLDKILLEQTRQQLPFLKDADSFKIV